MEFDDYDGNGNVGNTWHSKSGLNNNFGKKIKFIIIKLIIRTPTQEKMISPYSQI